MYYSKSTGGFYHAAVHGDAIPTDAVEITAEQHAALLEGQSSGKVISANATGAPVLQYPPPPSANDLLKQQITALEAQVTERRIREAVLGIDNGWLKGINDQIVSLRAKLT